MEKLKKNRTASFIIVAIVYVMATAVGLKVYNYAQYSWWLALLIADVIATIFTFIFSVLLKNASVYDPYWSVQPPIILLAFSIGKNLTTLGVLLLIVVSIWAIRLTGNWAYTFKSLLHQDWRYTMLKEKTGRAYPIINLVGIHLVPTLVVYACVLPAVYAILYRVELNFYSVVFLALSLTAINIQGIADVEMHKYRKNKNSPFINVGLWKYSRHPNYLGEICMWWGVALSVVVANLKAWYLVIGAVLNTVLFLTVSIPMADGKQSKKEGFTEYKQKTRMLLPIKKKYSK